MLIVNKYTHETYASITTNHSMTIDEALIAAGYERANDEADYIYSDGTEVYVDDCEMIF